MTKILKESLINNKIYGVHRGVLRSREQIICRIVTNVGNKYIYAHPYKIKIKSSVNHLPNHDILLGTSEQYDWYRNEEGAKSRIVADRLAAKLRTTDYSKYSYYTLIEVARLLKLDISEVEEQA
ncbi:hypothetical protein HCB33_14310 [Listeria sp. FSL L7-0233]|uniref:Uncharacterized protein n=1 Tax=Listeria cossartiae subsp. cayugensis TaxID=2713505 RepID=A0ABU2IRJ8_9LIST|nr:hypothetical protein [Listeria cossartiae]MBC2184530.1 hypothetical protein [Listeria cossartiae subsp. cossartiae]MDT0067320.1 hypothetical protein [Listeria cossartiae subsp. cayugensis]MDT0081167.1 hypothetical protein [Listeria cossartiae subsp. cayugensis]MDT0084003.1 hypothetical protein [Listeria cossartiae subsp. cayugensis]MDT0089529.1 hypothetical protein [Listeria cossartiae subsp. cayugensis]